jgi:hypothetical protein
MALAGASWVCLAMAHHHQCHLKISQCGMIKIPFEPPLSMKDFGFHG